MLSQARNLPLIYTFSIDCHKLFMMIKAIVTLRLYIKKPNNGQTSLIKIQCRYLFNNIHNCLVLVNKLNISTCINHII